MLFCNEENDSDVLHPFQISTRPLSFIADLCVGSEVTGLNKNSLFDTVLGPEGENLDTQVHLACGDDTSHQGAKNGYIATGTDHILFSCSPKYAQIRTDCFLSQLRFPSNPVK